MTQIIAFYEAQLNPCKQKEKYTKSLSFFDLTNKVEINLHASLIDHASQITQLRKSNKRLHQ